ncbi:hypothetical protein [Cupriavidus plantarum]|uniref:hypothetical protein n=1 Tax=Cupriavidus plantarum TaxID=942865 RepID=UPI000E2852E8|nr:hypothetical protein [Cupriavidus plantarum]REE88778.1 hypothetical protein C7418_4893 [Cupriavidus plantarum]
MLTRRLFCILPLAVSVLVSSPASASYNFRSGAICNGYTEVEGRILQVIATTTYSGTQGVYLKYRYESSHSASYGRVYPRSSQDWAYNHMVRMAMFLQAVGGRAKLCVNRDDIYAIAMMD